MLLKNFATAALIASSSVSAFPKFNAADFKRAVENAAANAKPEIRDGQIGRLVKYDAPLAFSGTKKIPG